MLRTRRYRARSSALTRTRRPGTEGLEADAMLVGLDAQVHDLGEIEHDGAVGRLDLAPAAAVALRQCLTQLREVLLRKPQGQHLAAREPDCRSSRRHAWSVAGSTSSVRTEPLADGCRNATLEPRMPVRGTVSIIRTPCSRSCASATA